MHRKRMNRVNWTHFKKVNVSHTLARTPHRRAPRSTQPKSKLVKGVLFIVSGCSLEAKLNKSNAIVETVAIIDKQKCIRNASQFEVARLLTLSQRIQIKLTENNLQADGAKSLKKKTGSVNESRRDAQI